MIDNKNQKKNILLSHSVNYEMFIGDANFYNSIKIKRFYIDLSNFVMTLL